MYGGGGSTLSAQLGIEDMSQLSSRTRFGICPTSPIARNAGQMQKQVQHDKSMYRNHKRPPSLRAVADRVAIQLGTYHRLSGLPRRSLRLLLAMTPPVKAASCLGWSLKSHVQPLWLAFSAFTMAEILLSLTIIGVVAAITLPSLTGNINERTWNTQRKALYARFSQAIALMPAINGYGTLKEITDSATGSASIDDTATETFITSGLAKVLKIHNICDNEHIEDCGITSDFTNLQGSKYEMPKTMYELNSDFNKSFLENDGTPNSYFQIDTKAAAFETANGESILAFYNPYCQSELGYDALHDFAQAKLCANFIYDLNGNKGPNTVGKDIGVISVLYPTDSVVVAPVPFNILSGTFEQDNASLQCRNLDSEARLPNLQEFSSIFYNKKLFGINSDSDGYHYWTSTLVSSNKAKCFHMSSGRIYSHDRTNQYAVRCVKR